MWNLTACVKFSLTRVNEPSSCALHFAVIYSDTISMSPNLVCVSCVLVYQYNPFPLAFSFFQSDLRK